MDVTDYQLEVFLNEITKYADQVISKMYSMVKYAYTAAYKAIDKLVAPVGPLAKGVNSSKILEGIVGESRTQIQRFIRLTELIPELLNLVDEGKLGLRTGVELSYINKDKQMEIFDIISMEEVYPTHAQAIRMRKLDEHDNLAKGVVGQIMLEQKPNQREKMSFNMARLEKLFPKNLPASKREDYMAAAMEHYARYLQRKERGQER